MQANTVRNRKALRRFFVISSFAMSLPFAAFAETARAANDGPEGCGYGHAMSMQGPGGHHGMRHGAEAGGFGGGHMMRGLDLSEAQRDQLFAMRHAQAPKMRELAKAMRESRRELRKLAMSETYDEARARSLVESASRAGSEMALLRVQMGNEMYRILTPEQRTKMQQRAEWREKRGERGPRGPGAEARS